jgi:tetratricopeptide (TPR) repeat protein
MIGIMVLNVVILMSSAGSAFAQPETVPKLTERGLGRASYVALAKEWKEYIEKNGETAEALVNLGMAYHYSHEMEAATKAAERAVEVEPDNPKALAFAGKILTIKGDRLDEAEELLLKCRRIAPDYHEALTTLAIIYLRRGDLEGSEKVFKTMFDQRTIRQPIQDYAYNMLLGLPEGAVLVTNGDDDTLPPLALQAGMNFRKDVIIINRHLFNIEEFAEAIFDRHPEIRPARAKKEKSKTPAAALLEQMIDEQKAPVYFALTVDVHDLGFEPDLEIEGFNLRSSRARLDAEE